MKTDYSAMDDAQLNRVIASWLGYAIITPEGKKMHLVNSNGVRVGSPQMTEVETWACAPDWAGNTDAALDLIKAYDWSSSYHGTDYCVHIHGVWIDEWGGKNSFIKFAANERLSRAICECWVILVEAQMARAFPD